MSKVRINDLARELEVKSKEILDALTAVGVKEKKTHSSSIEEDEAAKVRGFLTGGPGGRPAPAPKAPAKEPAFSLANVSKPGDALKAILERKQAEAAAKYGPPAPRPVVAKPAVVAAAPPAAVVARHAPPAPPAASATPTAPAPKRVMPQMVRTSHTVAATPPPAIASKPVVGPVVAKPPVVVAPPAPKTAVAAAPAPVAPPTPEPPAPVAVVPAAPVVPVRRVVMPQTGPRPSYTAPPVPPGGPPRKPIFARPGSSGPGGYPNRGPLPAGARRPMHPTRTYPT
ncbi:MAG: translation initiation factor IF-2 N-terminal domain-containing protein, partial [Bryocella sp.]